MLNWYMGRIERLVGTSGFAVGSKISLADISFYNIFGETLLDSEAPEGKLLTTGLWALLLTPNK